MALTVALDTNACSDWRSKGAWHDQIRLVDRILVPAIVPGELLHGFRKGSRFTVNRRGLDAFLSEP